MTVYDAYITILTIFVCRIIEQMRLHNDRPDEDGDFVMTLDVMMEYASENKNMLGPVTKMQKILKSRTLGSGWQKLANRRLQLGDGQYIKVRQFMNMVSPPT
jgi:hypothetical protein